MKHFIDMLDSLYVVVEHVSFRVRFGTVFKTWEIVIGPFPVAIWIERRDE